MSGMRKHVPVPAERDEVCYTADCGIPEYRKAECVDCFVILPRNDKLRMMWAVDDSYFAVHVP